MSIGASYLKQLQYLVNSFIQKNLLTYNIGGVIKIFLEFMNKFETTTASITPLYLYELLPPAVILIKLVTLEWLPRDNLSSPPFALVTYRHVE